MYKYLRDRNNAEGKILFDLKNDPNELTGISSENLDIQQELDKILTKLLKTKPQQNLNELTDEEQQKAEELLKKLGYIWILKKISKMKF